MRYEEITNKKLDEPSMLSINTVEGLLTEIDRRNDKFSEFRETRHTFFNVLEGALKPVEVVSNLSSGAASMAFPPSTLVLGAAVYLINAAKGVSASYDAIQSLMGRLKVSRYVRIFGGRGRPTVGPSGHTVSTLTKGAGFYSAA